MGENRESRSLPSRVDPTSSNFVIVSMNQRDELSNELISAYFDGELSPDESAHVERMVAGSDVHRQTLADMHSLAGDMRQLPRYQLGDHFAEQVTARVRRLVAWEKVSAASDTSSHAARLPGSVWNWPAVTGLMTVCAAALLVAAMIWSPRTGPSGSSGIGQVAVAPDATDHSSAIGDSGHKAANSAANSAATNTDGSSPGQLPSASPAIATELAASDRPTAAHAQPNVPPGAAGVGPVHNSDAAPATQLIAGSPDSLVPESAARMVPTVTPESPAEPKDLSDLPFGTDQQLLFVFEVSLTRHGAEQLAFENVLAQHQVAVDGAVAVDPQLEASLLESRYFDPVEHDARAQDKPRQPSCSLVYAQVRAGQVDEIWRSMQANPGFFAGMSFDMAILPADRTLFENLRQAMSRVPVAQSGLAAGDGRRQHAARRLTLPPQWGGKPANQPPRRNDTPPDSGSAKHDETPAIKAVPGQPQPGIPLMPGGNLGENIDAEVLFVLHLGPA